MSAVDLVQYLSQIIFVVIFVVVVRNAVRYRGRIGVDVALFFGDITAAIFLGLLELFLKIPHTPLLQAFSGALIMTLPYFFLRPVDDFTGLPSSVMRGVEVGTVLAVVSLFLIPQPNPLPLTLIYVVWFLGIEVYAAVMIVQAARKARGVTLRRLQSIAAGSILLGLTIVMAGFQAFFPLSVAIWSILGNLFALASGVAYFIGFAPPVGLRRYWQEPELRGFLKRAAELTRLPDETALREAIEQGAAEAIGASSAGLGFWDENEHVLRFQVFGRPSALSIERDSISSRAFIRQQAIYSGDVIHDNPEMTDLYREAGSATLLAAPVTVGTHRLGVLVANGSRPSFFADSDLELVQLLGDQAAVILHNRALIEDAASARARARELAVTAEERRRLYALLMDAPAMICHLVGASHAVEFANVQFSQLIGEGDPRGQPFDTMFPQLGRSYRDVIDRVYQTGESFFASEVLVQIPDSVHESESRRYLNVSFQATHDVDGSVDGVLMHAVDVTGQVVMRQEIEGLNVELEERVAQRTAELEATVRELEAFSYSVSHDLRAPLRTIDGFSLALLEDCGDQLDAMGKDELQRIRAAAQRMGMLIDDLLRLSRVTRSQMTREQVDLSALARTIAKDLSEAEPAREVDWSIDDGLIVDGDERLLRIALENLLGNAWKFTMRRERAEISFRRTIIDGSPVYFVRDNGVGFDMTYVDKLFNAFQRLHSTQEFAGSGVGLATVRRVIVRHGGKVWAEAEVGRGATFYFSLPESKETVG